MKTVSALAGVVVKELYRRKDFYVLFVLTALVTVMMGSMNFFHDKSIAGFLKEGCLWLIWISALVIAIVTTARQIPAECENRTIFPLLAKPVTRNQVVLGKFTGCWLATGVALVVFYLFFTVVAGTRENQWPLVNYLQAFWLQWMMLAIVIALVFLGSIVFAAPSSNSTICFVIVIGILLVGGHLDQVASRQPEPLRSIAYAIYFLIPHLEWYDVRQFVFFEQRLVPWGAFAKVTLYAGLYSAMLLFATTLVFRRKALNS
jgi:ABC-type transport system involved in multi-copper enzyme maturation permease subunit